MESPADRVSASARAFAPSALVLDMDGLLLDSEPLWFAIERDFARERGGSFTEADARACVGRGIPTTLEYMRRTYGIPVDIDRDTRLMQETFIASVARLTLKPGCLDFLDAAAVLPLAVASSSPLALIHAALGHFDLLPRFSAIVSGQMVTSPKPAPDIFLLAANKIGVLPERAAAFEDSLAGATAARAAGMFVVAVPEGPPEGRGFEGVAHRIVPDLYAALDHILLPER